MAAAGTHLVPRPCLMHCHFGLAVWPAVAEPAAVSSPWLAPLVVGEHFVVVAAGSSLV